MTTQEVQNPEVEVQEQVQQPDDDAAFAAGFAEARGDEPPAEAVQPEPEPVAEAEEEAPEPEPEEETVQETFAGLTQQQLMEGLARAVKAEEEDRRIYGKIGELQRHINSLQQANSGQPVELSKDDFAELAEDFPDLAEKIAKGLSGKLRAVAAPQGPAVDLSEIEARLTETEERLSRKYEAKLLAMQHPDWREVADSPEFAVWKGTLPQDVQAELETSWDAAYLSSAIGTFKNWRDQSKQTQQQRSARLEAAVTPQGLPVKGPAISEDDAFAAGFAAVRKR